MNILAGIIRLIRALPMLVIHACKIVNVPVLKFPLGMRKDEIGKYIGEGYEFVEGDCPLSRDELVSGKKISVDASSEDEDKGCVWYYCKGFYHYSLRFDDGGELVDIVATCRPETRSFLEEYMELRDFYSEGREWKQLGYYGEDYLKESWHFQELTEDGVVATSYSDKVNMKFYLYGVA